MTTAFAAFWGLFGVIVGAALTYWVRIRADAEQARQKQRTDAYVEFIEAVASIATGQRVWDQEKLGVAITRFTQAKSKIAIYGSRSVATALADSLKSHQRLDSEGAFQSFAAIVALMRADSSNGSQPLNSGDIEQILFRETLPLS